jgi:RNA polymerase sigma factor (sigma-70 family)
MVYRVCLKMTGNSSSAEDVAQEVFIKAYQVLVSYREEAAFSTWLYQITVRKCLDWRRVQDRERQHRSVASYTENDSITHPSPEHALLDKERDDEIQRIIVGLQEPYRTAIQLYYFHHCSYQEIADRQKMPIKTIESQLYRARRMIREKGGNLL